MLIKFPTLFILLGLILNVYASSSITLALSSSPSNLNPFFATDANSQNLNRLLHLSLTDFNQEMQFSCRLCKSYEESFRGEKHIITFKLKDDVTFWDGERVKAQDVKRSWEYYTDEKKIKSTFRFAFSSIENVKIIDDQTLEFVYDKFSLENLSNLALLKIVKIKNYSKRDKIELEDIIGAGPYQFDSIETLELVLRPTKKDLEKLIFKVVRDETTLALKLLNEEIDLSLANISPRKLNWLQKRAKHLDFLKTQGSNYVYLGLNHRTDSLKSHEVRKAIAHLIPRREIIDKKLKNTAELSNGLFSKAFVDYHSNDKSEAYNPELASELLKKAGYRKDEKNNWVKDSRPLSFSWKVTNNKSTIEIVEVLKHYLEKNGIQVDVTIQEWGTFMRSVKNGDFDIVMAQWIGFTGPDMLRFTFHSESVPPKGGNRGYFIDEEVDELLDKAESERDFEKRTHLFKKVAQKANEQYAYINLWHPNTIWVARKCIKLNEKLYSNGNFLPLLGLDNECRE